MGDIIKEIREIRVNYSYDEGLMLQKLNHKLTEFTEGKNDVNIDKLGINNNLGNEVLNILRHSQHSENISKNVILQILDSLGKLPMFPEVRNKLNGFRNYLQTPLKEEENIVSNTYQNQYSKNITVKPKKDYKKLLILILALIFIVIAIGSVLYYINRPVEKITFYKDADRDGYGSNIDTILAKKILLGYVHNADDPDDTKPCVPDSTTQACIKSKESINPPSSTNGTGNGTTGGDTSISAGNGPTVPGAGPTTGPGRFNCPTLSKNIGDTCDDGNPKTLEDKVNSNCICVGKSGPTPVKDADEDKIEDLKDACPTRKGPSFNKGCPDVKLKGNLSINIDEKSSLSLEYDEALPSDQIKWDSKGLSLSSGIGKSIEITSDIVGNYRLNYILSNKTDGFELEDSHIIKVRMSNSRLEKELKNIAEVGNNKLLKIEEIEDKGNVSKNYLARCIGSDITVNKVSKTGSSTPIKYDTFIDELLSSKRSIDTHIRNIKISKIDYDEISGKIKSFSYSIN